MEGLTFILFVYPANGKLKATTTRAIIHSICSRLCSGLWKGSDNLPCPLSFPFTFSDTSLPLLSTLWCRLFLFYSFGADTETFPVVWTERLSAFYDYNVQLRHTKSLQWEVIRLLYLAVVRCSQCLPVYLTHLNFPNLSVSSASVCAGVDCGHIVTVFVSHPVLQATMFKSTKYALMKDLTQWQTLLFQWWEGLKILPACNCQCNEQYRWKCL